MLRKQVVMCNPYFYDVTYELSTNPWMNLQNLPDKDLAVRQWQKLHSSFSRKDIEITWMPGYSGLSDMVFVANAGLPVGKNFILSRFFHSERELEVPHIRHFLSSRFNVIELPGRGYFEGQGDAMFINPETLVVGYGVRTNLDGIQNLSDVLRRIAPEVKIVPLKMRPQKDYADGEKMFYHLDTCLKYFMGVGRFVAYSEAFTLEAEETIYRLGSVVNVSQREAESFACNSVEARDTIFTPNLPDDSVLFELYSTWGYEVLEHNVSEFIKSGGAVKCLTLELNG